jgi:S1-C subfamily serine protease
MYLAVAVVAASIGAGATVVLNGNSAATPAGSSAQDLPAQHDNAAGSGSAGASLNQAKVEKKVEPGLVDITSTLKYNSETAEGTGMILSADGLVLTNNHVIDQSTSITATTAVGGTSYRAKVLGYDATDDVALLRLEGASGLPAVSFGNSSQVSIGAKVLALGNAEGRGGVTPAAGIIDALNRSIKASDEGSGGTENLHNMLQTSAQIQQGDSGGALANNAGQVIGMITAANSTSGQPGSTIGFAIPINSALAIARQVASGTASSTVYIGTPGFLGVVLPASTSSDPQRQATDEQRWIEQNDGTIGGFPGGTGGIPGGSAGSGGPGGPGRAGNRTGCVENNSQLTTPATIAPASSGVLIIDDFCGTAVFAAGLTPGDVITSVNGQPISTPDSLRNAMATYHPGTRISIGWVDTRGGKHTTPMTLTTGPVR